MTAIIIIHAILVVFVIFALCAACCPVLLHTMIDSGRPQIGATNKMILKLDSKTFRLSGGEIEKEDAA
jgi:hypothetical protein